MAGFQQTVNMQPGVGIEGDWCSANPRSSMLAGVGGLVAGPNGVTAGRFAWADPEGVVRNNGGAGRLGFVHRDQVSLITAWLAQSTMLVPPGQEITLFDSADVWCRFAAGATVGQKVYASFVDGTASAAASGAPSGATSTTFTIAPATSSFTGSISNGILTVTGAVTGTIYPGTIISGAGVPTGDQIISQLSGTTGGDGTYELSINDGVVVVSEAITGSYGLLTAGGTITGTFSVGDPLSGTGVSGSITALGTGTGGAGTYIVSPSQTAATGTITAGTNIETRWFVDSYAAPGELAKISTKG